MHSTIHAGKLHKLLYFAQKRSIKLANVPLFNEPIEAWIHGASVNEVYKLHRGQEYVSWSNISKGRINKLCEQHRRLIIDILKEYTQLNTIALSILNQNEYAFIKARGNLPPYAKGTKDNEITVDLIKKGIELKE